MASLSMTYVCSVQFCGQRLYHANVSGMCRFHLNRSRRNETKRCQKCDEPLGWNNLSGFCQLHRPARVRGTKHCPHCGVHIHPGANWCRSHLSPVSRMDAETRAKYDLLRHRLKMTVAEARAMLESGEPLPYMKPVTPRPRVTISALEVIADTCARLGVLADDVCNGGRHMHLVIARATIVRILRHHGLSYPMIGRRLGGRDHTTLIHADRKFDTYARHDPYLRAVVEDMIAA